MTSKPVVVVGAGNAAFSAALSAREKGAEVIVLERAPMEARGGNTAFVGGALRMICNGADDITKLVPDLAEDLRNRSTFENFTAENFLDALAEATDYRIDPDLAEVMVHRSAETFRWLRTKGLRFDVMYGRQAHEVDGRFTFFGGQAIETWGGGAEWSKALFEAGERHGVDIRYNTRALSLLTEDDGSVRGVRVRSNGRMQDIEAGAVVLACGGFQANREWRAKLLGPGWDLAKVRGTQFNTGDGLQMALDVGASPAGHWSGAHAVGWDLNAPEFGDRQVGDGFQKHSYTFGVMVNANGERFLDEGANFRNFTYAKYGKDVLEQPRQFAWQVYDAKVHHLLRDEYRIREITKVTADTLQELAAKMDGVDAAGFLKTVEEFNSSVPADAPPFNPNVLDGRHTVGLPVIKSNWAQRIDEPPFEAYGITCGITFTFGGLRINTDAEVISADGGSIPGLYAAGEIVGGLFYFNYPSGSGLTGGAVFGRIAGAKAAQSAEKNAVR